VAPERGAQKPLDTTIHRRIFPDTFITAAYRSSRCAAAAVSIRANFHGKQIFSLSGNFFKAALVGESHPEYRPLPLFTSLCVGKLRQPDCERSGFRCKSLARYTLIARAGSRRRAVQLGCAELVSVVLRKNFPRVTVGEKQSRADENWSPLLSVFRPRSWRSRVLPGSHRSGYSIWSLPDGSTRKALSRSIRRFFLGPFPPFFS
jgi:hypothetical protein